MDVSHLNHNDCKSRGFILFLHNRSSFWTKKKNSEGCEFHFVDKFSRSDRSFPLLAAKTEGEAQDLRIARHALKLDAKFPGRITNLQIGSKMSHSIGQTWILTPKRCSRCFKSVVFDFFRRSVTKRGSAASSL